MDVLWLTGEYLEPRTQGMYQYSGALADVVSADHAVEFIGRKRSDFDESAGCPEEWRLLAPKRRSNVRRVASRWPTKVGDIWGRDYARAVEDAMTRRPRVVVIDHMRAGGALEEIADVPMVFVTHNDEWAVKKLAARHQTQPHVSAAFHLDAIKHHRYEDRLLNAAALVTTITPEDADAFGRRTRTPILWAPPQWPATIPRATPPSEDTPRRILLMGSLAWEEKRKNLRELLTALRSEPSLSDVIITVTGGGHRAPELEAAFPDVEFHAYIDDMDEMKASSRLGIIYEPVGGGFKMKTLDYVFSRIPLMVFEGSAVGLGAGHHDWHLSASTLPEMVDKIVDVIDDVEQLDRLQARAFARCTDMFGPTALDEFRSAVAQLVESGELHG